VKRGVSNHHAVEELPVIDFISPMPGFTSLVHFVLVQLPGSDSQLFELRSLDDPEVRFLVANPAAFFPDYSIELGEEARAELELGDGSDALVLVVLTIGDELATTTANLAAPVVVNVRTRSASQVILSGGEWPVRAALV